MLEQSELVQALSPVVRFFVNQQIDYFVGGSVASSHHGASRSTLDVDLTVVFRDVHIKPIIDELSGEFYLIAAAEDIILIKLQWYRLGNEVSERQWTDLTNVLRLNRQKLDVGYLRTWAKRLEVDDLLSRLFET